MSLNLRKQIRSKNAFLSYVRISPGIVFIYAHEADNPHTRMTPPKKTTFLHSSFTGGFRCCRFRVQLGRVQGSRVQLFAQRIERLSIHYGSVGVKAIGLVLALLRRHGLRGSRLGGGLWLGLGLLFLLGLDMKISMSNSFIQILFVHYLFPNQCSDLD